MNWLALIESILGVGAKIVPVFIHNPKSQQIEAAVVTTVAEIGNIAAQLGPPSAVSGLAKGASAE